MNPASTPPPIRIAGQDDESFAPPSRERATAGSMVRALIASFGPRVRRSSCHAVGTWFAVCRIHALAATGANWVRLPNLSPPIGEPRWFTIFHPNRRIL